MVWRLFHFGTGWRCSLLGPWWPPCHQIVRGLIAYGLGSWKCWHMTLMFQTLGYPPSLAVVTKNSGLCWKHCEQSIDSRGNGTRWQEIRLRMLWSRQGFPCPWLQLHSKSLWQNTCSLRSTDVFLRLRKDFWISSLHLRAFDAGKVLPKSSWGKFGSDSHCKLLSNENGGWWSLILSQFKGICLLLSSSSSSSSS